MSNIIATIQSESPKAWSYFEDYYGSYLDDKSKSLKELALQELPFEMLFGVCISFFNTINIDVDIYSNEKEALEESIKESFNTYEEYLFLDS